MLWHSPILELGQISAGEKNLTSAKDKATVQLKKIEMNCSLKFDD